MTQYKIGDVVQLKSGGPLMTVHEVGDYSPHGPNPGLLCAWFDDRKRVQEVFHPDAVQRYVERASFE